MPRPASVAFESSRLIGRGSAAPRFSPGAKLLDWPMAASALMSHLGLERVRLLAISGGAPYAYATARAMPERVEAIAIVSGAPPIAELQDRAGLLRLYRWMLAIHARQPGRLAGAVSSRLGRLRR